jgi:serine protease Do
LNPAGQQPDAKKSMKIHRYAPALGIVALCATVTPPAWAQGTHVDFLRSNPKFLQAFREVVAYQSQSTVRVRSDDMDIALGVIVGADGWIVTKAFDLKGKITCRFRDGRDLEARIVGVHTVHDLAVLKVDAHDLPAANLKPSRRTAVGSWVVSVGLGDDPVAVGVVSVPTRDVVFKGLPIAATELSKTAYLGVALEPADGKGVRITQVMPNTAASKAGLKQFDVIASVAGVPVQDPEQFQLQMVKHRPGDQITLRVRRGDDELDIEAKLQQRPAGDNRSELQNNMGSQLSARRSGYPTILTHDSVVKPADCGGPLVDLDGNVIGINISRAGRTESWAIPTEVIQSVLPDLKSGKLAPVGTPSASASERPSARSAENRRGVEVGEPQRASPKR